MTLFVVFILGCVFFGAEITMLIIGVLFSGIFVLGLFFGNVREGGVVENQQPEDIYFKNDNINTSEDVNQYVSEGEEEYFDEEIEDPYVYDYDVGDIEELRDFINSAENYQECKDHISRLLYLYRRTSRTEDEIEFLDEIIDNYNGSDKWDDWCTHYQELTKTI